MISVFYSDFLLQVHSKFSCWGRPTQIFAVAPCFSASAPAMRACHLIHRVNCRSNNFQYPDLLEDEHFFSKSHQAFSYRTHRKCQVLINFDLISGFGRIYNIFQLSNRKVALKGRWACAKIASVLNGLLTFGESPATHQLNPINILAAVSSSVFEEVSSKFVLLSRCHEISLKFSKPLQRPSWFYDSFHTDRYFDSLRHRFHPILGSRFLFKSACCIHDLAAWNSRIAPHSTFLPCFLHRVIPLPKVLL